LDIVKSATEEILWIFPTTNAFIRQDKMGAIQLAKEAAEKKNVKVRILVPANRLIEQKIQDLKQHCPNRVIDVRFIEKMSETKATILVVDRKASLVMELRDDSKTTFIEAIGLSTYSNSKAGVSSYVAIFENLWNQTELYQNVKEALESLAQSNKQLALANEQLKIHDKMQEEFINIAAHELRTPIQPILGLSQIIQYESKDIKQRELLDIIIRNAKRLQVLANDILDVTKIESNSLQLSKEQFSLNEMISNTIADSRNRIKKEYKDSVKLVLVFNAKVEEDIFVNADKSRIYQVISNLLSNAIKFTRGEASITIIVEKKEEETLVSIKDTGVGIDSEILPRLFTKFARKPEIGGTGLGLFISKSIIEAHGGRIWAENNPDGKGATFYFSLPVSNNKQ
jgi:signal transduction histidine kinase